MRTSQLLEYFSLPDLFTLAYVLVDDHLQLLSALGSYQLPMARNRQATPSELITIALVGDLLGQKNSETWFALVRQLYADLSLYLADDILVKVDRIGKRVDVAARSGRGNDGIAQRESCK